MATREGKKITCPKCSSLIAEPETPLYQCPVCLSLFLGKTAKRSSSRSSSKSSEGSSHRRNAGPRPGADAPKARLISEAKHNFSGDLLSAKVRKNEPMHSGAEFYEPWGGISPSIWPTEDSSQDSRAEDLIRNGSRGSCSEQQVKNLNMNKNPSKMKPESSSSEAACNITVIKRLFDLSLLGITDDELSRKKIEEALSPKTTDLEKTSMQLEYFEPDAESLSVGDEKMHEENEAVRKETDSSGVQEEDEAASKEPSSSCVQEENKVARKEPSRSSALDEEKVDTSDLVSWGIKTRDIELLSKSVSHSDLQSEEEINYEEISYVDVSFDQWKHEQAENTNAAENTDVTGSGSSSSFHFTESAPNSVGSNAQKQSPWKIQSQNSSVSDVSKQNSKTGYPLPAPTKPSTIGSNRTSQAISVRRRGKSVSQPLNSTQNVDHSAQTINRGQDLEDRRNPKTDDQRHWSNTASSPVETVDQRRAEVRYNNNISASHQLRKRYDPLPRHGSVRKSTLLVEVQKEEQLKVSSAPVAMSTAEFLSSHHCIICIHEQFHVKKSEAPQISCDHGSAMHHSHHDSAQKGSKKVKRYPPLPKKGVLPYILCRHCGIMLEVPVGVSPSEGSTQRLRCSSCGKISKFKVLVQGNSPSLGFVTISATVNRNSTAEFMSGLVSKSEISAELSEVVDDDTASNGSVQNTDLYPSHRFNTQGKRNGRLESDGYLSMSSSVSSGSARSQLQKQQPIIRRESDNAEDEKRQSFAVSPDRFSRSSSDRDENEITVAPGSPLIEHFAHDIGDVSARTYEKRLLRASNVSIRSNASSESSSIYEHNTNESPLVMSQGSGSGKGPKYYAGLISKGITDFTKAHQVVVNGHVIKKDAIYTAQEKAGFILPGSYWYDYGAGFWGVIGGPCLGIVLPCIEEFNFPMARDCSGGNTGILVNGRELHEQDLDVLARRGLSTTPGKSYTMDINGQVFDPVSGHLVRSLGRLAPSVLKNARGFGMSPPS